MNDEYIYFVEITNLNKKVNKKCFKKKCSVDNFIENFLTEIEEKYETITVFYNLIKDKYTIRVEEKEYIFIKITTLRIEDSE